MLPRQYVAFDQTDFYFVLAWDQVTFKVRVFHLRQTNFASYEESTIRAVVFSCVKHGKITSLVSCVILCIV